MLQFRSLGLLGLTVALSLLLEPQPASPQSTTVPLSSLPTRQLSGTDETSLLPSCELCRPPEKRSGSDLLRDRHRRNTVPHPRKKPAGVHGSINGSMKSTLPSRPLRAENQEAPDPATDLSARAGGRRQ